ncbi:MAG: hypothetical protein ACFFG0_00725 [Candidatus Thorarchaeota archaeon]
MSTKNDYLKFLYNDFIYFLVTNIITDKEDAVRQAELIIDTWAERNEKLIKKAMKAQTKVAMKEDETLEEDVAMILLEIREVAFKGLRYDIAEKIKEGLLPTLEKLKK